MMNSRSPIFSIIVVTIIGVTLSLLAFFLLQKMETERDLADFKINTEQHADLVRHRLLGTIETVKSIAALYAASEQVNRKEFAKFIDIEMQGMVGIQAIEWIPRVKARQREEFETLARNEGLVDFRFTEKNSQGEIVTAARRDSYFPVYFVEPLKGNETALGFDLASNPTRLEALNRARDTGLRQATARITLVQEAGEQYGILVFQPVYRGAEIPETVTEKRQQLSGFALGVFRIGDIIGAESEKLKHNATEIFVFDGAAPLGQQLLFPAQSSYQSPGELAQKVCQTTPLMVGGRSWQLMHCQSGQTTSYLANHATSSLALFAGLLTTILMALYLRRLANQRMITQGMLVRLEASEARFSALAMASPVAIYIKDLNGRFLLASQAYQDWYGIQGEVKGKTVYDFFPKADADIYSAQDREVIKSASPRQWEVDMPSSSGKRMSVLAVKFPIYGHGGEMSGIGGINLDLTERKEAVAQVIQATKLATLGEMATSVAHELNQPLNVIRMASGNVQRKLRKGNVDTEYLLGKLERIAAQTERAASIITHMRMFGRKADDSPSQIHPCDMMEGALDLMGEQLRLEEIEVRVGARPEHCPLILGHQVQLEQVILNLLTNARDAILSHDDLNEKWIRLAVEITGPESVQIIVEDNGGGIPDKVIERIFEPFYTTKEIGKGTGLGLSVSYGIIREMGGSIEAGNGAQGARFTITLPIVDAASETG